MTTLTLTFALLMSAAVDHKDAHSVDVENGVPQIKLDELVAPALDQLRPTVIEGVDASPTGIAQASRLC